MSGTRGFSLLHLLPLLLWNEGTGVHCQTVHVSKVLSDHVLLTWDRTENWLGVKDFQVQFKTPKSSVCDEAILCQTPVCSFNSGETCGTVTPCSETTTIISGGNFTAQHIEIVTGPEHVTNLTLNIDFVVQHITWNNPPKDSSPCHKQTAVRFILNWKSATTNHSVEEEHQDVELCREEGAGNVEVWTEGGDGESYIVSSPFISNGSSVVDLVKVSSCESLGCTSLLASWDYLPVCSAVTSFEVGLDYYGEVYGEVDVDATNITITGLPPSVSYKLCVRAVDDHGDYIDASCQTCYSPAAYVKNVQSVALTARSMRVTWDAPLCPVTNIAHNIKYSSGSHTRWASSHGDNSQELKNLEYFPYTVCVQVGGGVDEPVCITAFTKLRQPYVRTSSPSADSINLSWDFDEDRYLGFTITYQVTWGPNQQYKGQTQEKGFTIKNYTATSPYGEPICVAAFPNTTLELMSEPYCVYQYGPDSGHGYSNGVSVTIISVSVWVALIVIVVAVVAVVHLRSRRRQANTSMAMRPPT